MTLPEMLKKATAYNWDTTVRKWVKYRKAIYKRDNWRCVYCQTAIDKSNATIDHVIPKSEGGSNLPENLLTCCANCNRQKSTLPVIDFIELKGLAYAVTLERINTQRYKSIL